MLLSDRASSQVSVSLLMYLHWRHNWPYCNGLRNCSSSVRNPGMRRMARHCHWFFFFSMWDLSWTKRIGMQTFLYSLLFKKIKEMKDAANPQIVVSVWYYVQTQKGDLVLQGRGSLDIWKQQQWCTVEDTSRIRRRKRRILDGKKESR